MNKNKNKKSRAEAAREIQAVMQSCEHELALAYSTIYRKIWYNGCCWCLWTSPRTSHYNYTVDAYARRH